MKKQKQIIEKPTLPDYIEAEEIFSEWACAGLKIDFDKIVDPHRETTIRTDIAFIGREHLGHLELFWRKKHNAHRAGHYSNTPELREKGVKTEAIWNYLKDVIAYYEPESRPVLPQFREVTGWSGRSKKPDHYYRGVDVIIDSKKVYRWLKAVVAKDQSGETVLRIVDYYLTRMKIRADYSEEPFEIYEFPPVVFKATEVNIFLKEPDYYNFYKSVVEASVAPENKQSAKKSGKKPEEKPAASVFKSFDGFLNGMKCSLSPGGPRDPYRADYRSVEECIDLL